MVLTALYTSPNMKYFATIHTPALSLPNIFAAFWAFAARSRYHKGRTHLSKKASGTFKHTIGYCESSSTVSPIIIFVVAISIFLRSQFQRRALLPYRLLSHSQSPTHAFLCGLLKCQSSFRICALQCVTSLGCFSKVVRD